MSNESGMLIKIRDMQQTLTPVNQRIAAYILKDPERVVRMSVRELAKQSNASDAAVIRFCKSVGIGGYRELIVGLSGALGAQDETAGSRFGDILPGDTLESIIKNISFSNRQSIDDTLQVLDGHEVARAVEVLKVASHIAFFGIGASALVAMDAQQKFSRIGRMCHAYTNSHDQLTATVLMEKKDVAVIISNSGETREIVEALNVLKQTPCRTIAITRHNASALGDAADIRLNFSTPEITIRSGAMGSRIAMLNIVDILYTGVASGEYKKIKGYLQRTREVLQKR